MKNKQQLAQLRLLMHMSSTECAPETTCYQVIIRLVHLERQTGTEKRRKRDTRRETDKLVDKSVEKNNVETRRSEL